MRNGIRNYVLVALASVVLGSVIYKLFISEPDIELLQLREKVSILETERSNAVKAVTILRDANERLQQKNDSLYTLWLSDKVKFENSIDSIKNRFDEERIINRGATTDERILLVADWLSSD